MTTKTIKIQYLDESIPKLTYVGGKSDWIDLAAAETVTLKASPFPNATKKHSQKCHPREGGNLKSLRSKAGGFFFVCRPEGHPFI